MFQNLKQHKIDLKHTKSWMINARPHFSAIRQNYLVQGSISTVHQSPYSPDLNRCDRYFSEQSSRSLQTSILMA